MNDVPAFVAAVRRYAKRAKIGESTASLRVLNDGKRLALLADGAAGITVRRLHAAKVKLKELEAELVAREHAA